MPTNFTVIGDSISRHLEKIVLNTMRANYNYNVERRKVVRPNSTTTHTITYTRKLFGLASFHRTLTISYLTIENWQKAFRHAIAYNHIIKLLK